MAHLALFMAINMTPGFAAHFFIGRILPSFNGLTEEEMADRLYWVKRKVNILIWLQIISFIICLQVLGIGDTLMKPIVAFLMQHGDFFGFRTTFFIAFAIYLFLFFVFYSSGILFVQSSLYRIEKLIRKVSWSLKEHTLHNLKGLALVFIPIILWSLLVLLLPGGIPALAVSSALFMAALFAVYPFFIMKIYKAKPLNDAVLYSMLERLCQKAGVRFCGIHVLEMSGGKVANAFISGILPFYRHIFITDLLLKKCSHEEIRAILGHEIGHIKKRHIAGNWAFAILNPALLLFLLIAIPGLSNMQGVVFSVVLFLWNIMYCGFVFGYYSRWCERQADRYAVELTGNREAVISALHALARLNHMPKRWAWTDRMKTHPS